MVLALTVLVVVVFVLRRGGQPETYHVELGPPPGAQAAHTHLDVVVAVVVVAVFVVDADFVEHETQADLRPKGNQKMAFGSLLARLSKTDEFRI